VLGRQGAPIKGIEHIAGPAIISTPARVRLEELWEQPSSDYLQQLQKQAIGMVPFEAELSIDEAHHSELGRRDVIHTYAMAMQCWLHESAAAV
jgi:hypothetical protein